MARNALNPVAAWILFIFSIILITPTTLTYIPASLYLFMGMPEAPGLILFTLLAGYGLYCSWCITLKMDEYTQFGVPPHIYVGIAAGTIALLMLAKIFGIHSSIHEIIENPFSAIVSGYGPPLISSYTSLLVICFMRRNTVGHG